MRLSPSGRSAGSRSPDSDTPRLAWWPPGARFGRDPVSEHHSLSAFSRLYARASGIPLLVILLVVTFAIAGDLGHEAWETARVTLETADRALPDYTRFAASTMAARATAS